jgi:uncharacterized membrane protein (Fun14 family)
MSETAAIEFLVVLIVSFRVAYGLGYFIRKSIKVIAFMFGMFFFVVGIFWYAGVIDSYSAIQKWIEDVMNTCYDKTQEITAEIEKIVDAKKDGSGSQMLIIMGISSFFTGMLFGLGGKSDKKGLRISAD